MSLESTMAGYYARRAGEYERIYEKPERQNDLAVLRGFVRSTFSDRRVLEIACGTGYWTEILSGVAGSVTAVDINDETLAIARSKVIDARKVTFQRADVYKLPEFATKFDAGLAAFWWSHVPKSGLRAFLKGLHAVFALGSRLVFIDNVYVEGSSTPVSRIDADGNSYQLRKLDDGSTHEVMKNFPSEAELKSAVEGFGAQIRIEFLKYYWILSYTPTR